MGFCILAGNFFLAYPPGIPVLCPSGKVITAEIIQYVQELKDAGLYSARDEDPRVESKK